VGSGLGSGGFAVYDETKCVVEPAFLFYLFLHMESCGPVPTGQAELGGRGGVPRGDPEDEREQVLEEGPSRPVRGLQPANRVAISRRTNPLRSADAVGLGLKWELARKEREDA
jgi:hypothetical protein